MSLKLTVWIVLFLTGLATHQAIDVFFRPNYGAGEGAIPYLLGIAPNFIAAALIFPFAALTFRDSYANDIQKGDSSNLDKWFWSGLLISQIGLITWEFLQKSGKLIFDTNDILATIAGGVTAVGIYLLNKRPHLKRMRNKQSTKNS
jgi:hypothetical protein